MFGAAAHVGAQLAQLAEQRSGREAARDDDVAAAIEARVLEDALDQAVQGTAGGGDAVEEERRVAVARQVRLVGEQVGVADDDVQRRAQLVRHVGDELGLQAVRLAQPMQQLLGLALLLAALGDVAGDALVDARLRRSG